MHILLIDPVAGNRRLMQVWMKGALASSFSPDSPAANHSSNFAMPEGAGAATGRRFTDDLSFSEAQSWQEAKSLYWKEPFDLVFIDGRCVTDAMEDIVSCGVVWPCAAVYLVGAKAGAGQPEDVGEGVECIKAQLAHVESVTGWLEWPVGKQGMSLVLEQMLAADGLDSAVTTGGACDASNAPLYGLREEYFALTSRLAASLDELTGTIKEQLAKKDVAGACKTAHSLKGVAMTFNLLNLVPLTRELHDYLQLLQEGKEKRRDDCTFDMCTLHVNRVCVFVEGIRKELSR